MNNTLIRLYRFALLLLLASSAHAALVQSIGSTNSALQTTIVTGTLSTAPTTGQIITVAITSGGNGTGTITPPSGFTLQSTLATSATNGFYCSIFQKVAGGSETTTYTFTSSTNNWMASTIFVNSGRNTSSPNTFITKTIGPAAAASPLSIALTSGTAAAGDDVLYVGATFYGNTNGVTFTPPTSFGSAVTTQYLTSGFTPSLVTAVHQGVSAGAVGTLTGSNSWTGGGSRDWVGFVISLAAAAGGSCTHDFWSSSSTYAVPNGSSGSYWSTATGAFATPNCSTGTYWLSTGAAGST